MSSNIEQWLQDVRQYWDNQADTFDNDASCVTSKVFTFEGSVLRESISIVLLLSWESIL